MEERKAFDEPMRSRSGAPFDPAMNYEPPIFGTPPYAPMPPPPRRRSVSMTVLAVGIAAALGAGIAGGWAVFGAKVFAGDDTVTLHGSLTLTGNAIQIGEIDDATGNHRTCIPTDGYNDISPGTAVIVGNDKGAAVGVGQLGAGIPGDRACVYPFTVNVPKSTLYTVTISHRGTQTFTAAQATSSLDMSLGG